MYKIQIEKVLENAFLGEGVEWPKRHFITRKMATSQHPALKLNSPAVNVEPLYYRWPLQTGSGAAHDNGIEILDAIRHVCEDMPEIKAALEDITLSEIDTTKYEDMSKVCDIYNKAIDSVAALVRFI